MNNKFTGPLRIGGSYSYFLKIFILTLFAFLSLAPRLNITHNTLILGLAEFGTEDGSGHIKAVGYTTFKGKVYKMREGSDEFYRMKTLTDFPSQSIDVLERAKHAIDVAPKIIFICDRIDPDTFGPGFNRSEAGTYTNVELTYLYMHWKRYIKVLWLKGPEDALIRPAASRKNKLAHWMRNRQVVKPFCHSDIRAKLKKFKMQYR